LHEAITRVCETRSEELARFIETSRTFPNSMVDRITPQTTDDDRAWLRDEIGIEDGWPVVAEPFRQWVLEDTFAAGRPNSRKSVSFSPSVCTTGSSTSREC
jgi:mannitol 2-dehydrogenase